MSTTPAIVARVFAFTVLVPGTVIGWGPWLLVRSRPRVAIEWSSFAAWIGLILLAMGVLTYLLCAWEFATRGRGTPAPFDPPKELVVSGLYRLSRNPMYVGVIAALLGEAILYQSTKVAGYAGCVALVFHVWTVIYEEPKLRRSFGDSFASYCATVPRWIPLPWRARDSS